MSLSEEFVSDLFDSVISQAKDTYLEMFLKTDLKDIKDSYFLEAYSFFQKLNDSERQTLIKIISQTSIDTVAGVFSILDGVSSLNNFPEDFSVTYGSKEKALNYLSDSFLEYVENRNDP